MHTCKTTLNLAGRNSGVKTPGKAPALRELAKERDHTHTHTDTHVSMGRYVVCTQVLVLELIQFGNLSQPKSHAELESPVLEVGPGGGVWLMREDSS